MSVSGGHGVGPGMRRFCTIGLRYESCSGIERDYQIVATCQVRVNGRSSSVDTQPLVFRTGCYTFDPGLKRICDVRLSLPSRRENTCQKPSLSALRGLIPTGPCTWDRSPAPTFPPISLPATSAVAGNRVAMVSGSDQHGTPIADPGGAGGHDPQEVVDALPHRVPATAGSASASPLTSTPRRAPRTTSRRRRRSSSSSTSRATSTSKTMEQTYCVQEGRFLPDRYVEGTCPHCGYRGRPRRPVRQLRSHPGPGRPDQPALPSRRLRRRSARASSTSSCASAPTTSS